MIILETLLIVIILAVAFININPMFGGRVTKKDKANYSTRADNFKNGKFTYPSEYVVEVEHLEDNLSKKGKAPKTSLPVIKLDFNSEVLLDEVTVTWMGHSSVLLNMHGMNILFDPVFSKFASPISFIGPKRFSKLPIEIDEVPDIDILIITHNHYDHLDRQAIKKLDNKVGKYIVPLGIEKHLKRWNINEEKIKTMAWWEETMINGLTIACTPVRHFSNRQVFDIGENLYASWVLKDENHKIFESGDGGFGSHFEEIHEKYGDFDLALMENGQYNNRWHDVHMFPEESANAADILKAKVSMPIHWGAYVLSKHGWDDSVERFTHALESKGKEVITPKIGETVCLSNYKDYKVKWWRDIE